MCLRKIRELDVTATYTGNDSRTDASDGNPESDRAKAGDPRPDELTSGDAANRAPADPEPSPATPLTPSTTPPTRAGAVAPEPARIGRGRLALVVAGLWISVALAGLDLTLVATALPTISGELAGLGQSSWLIAAYLLASTVVLPIHAALGNRFGRKGAYVLAGLVFLAGSALAGLADTMTELIAYRVVQGVGAGGLLIGARAIVTGLLPAERRGRPFALIGTAFGPATLGGAFLGGYLVEAYDWRWCFFVNAPLGAGAVLIALVTVRLPKPAARTGVDLSGMLVLAGLSVCAVLLAPAAVLYGWADPVTLGLAGATVALLLVFVLVERAAAQPVIPLRLFRDRVFAVGAPIGLVVGFVTAGSVAYLPLFLQFARGASPLESAVLLLPLVGGVFVASVFTGRVAAAGRGKPFAVGGMLLAGVGTYLLTTLTEATTDVYNGVATGLLGVGLGLVVPVLAVAVRSSAGADVAGVATAAANYLRHLGAAVGAAMLGALFLRRVPAALAEHAPGDAAPNIEALTPHRLSDLADGPRAAFAAIFTDAVPPVFQYAVPALGAGLVLALFLRKPTPSLDEKQPDPMPTDARASSNGFVAVAHRPGVTPEPETQRPAPENEPDMHDAHTTDPAAMADIKHDEHSPTDRIRVFVRQEDGTPIKGAVLTLIDSDGNQAGRSIAAGGGVYHLPLPSEGAYVLIARADFHNPRAIPLRVTNGPVEVEVVLGGESGLGGVVYAPDGTTVDGATVTLCDSQGAVVASRSTDTDGEYDFADLMPGSYTLTVNAPSLQPSALSIRVPESGRIRQDVRLVGGSEIYGTAWTRRDHKPIPEARVTLLDRDGNVIAATTTDERGHFEFTNMTDGDYTLVASSYPPCASPVTLADGQAVEHDVVLGYDE